MNQYAAGIILYHPDYNRLKANIDAVYPQVDRIYCYNNGLGDDRSIENLLGSYVNIILMGDGDNIGIASALNQIVERAHMDGIQWLLTLDQDSVVCEGMVKAFSSLTGLEKVGIICPQLQDDRRKNQEFVQIENSYTDVDLCFTSGSFVNVEIVRDIGGYDDFLFVDLVDHDICIRMKYEGYRIIRDNSMVLNHELGKLTPSRFETIYLKAGKMLHSDTIKKLSYKREVSSMRTYYATRNMIYMKKKYANYMEGSYWNKKLIKNSFSCILRCGGVCDLT